MVPGAATPGPHGPQVIPGVYTLKLTVDGQVYTRSITVVNDPRVGESPQLMAALRAQNKLNFLSVQGMEQTFEGHGEVEAVRSQLSALIHGNLSGDVATQAQTLDRALTKIGGVIPAAGEFGGFGRPPSSDANALKSFMDLNNDYNTMVSMMQVGLDMAPTPTQIATWESDCSNYNRTVAAWKDMQQQISGFNTVLGKNQLQQLTLAPIKVSNATCSFTPEVSRKVGKPTSAR
jgi:hypothetical protein